MDRNRTVDKGKPIYKTNCPDCGSSDAKQVFQAEDGSLNAWCFSCGTYDKMDDKGEDNVVPINTQQKININSLPTLEIADRKLTQETVERFGVKVAVSEQDGKTITHHYYPDTRDGKVVGHECRVVDTKQFTSIGDRKGDLDLWGQNLDTGTKKLFITEGRLDAMSLYQAIKTHMPSKYNSNKEPAVVSLTRGVTGAAKDLLVNREYMQKFEDVILVFDQDTAGQEAIRDVLKTFPMCKVAKLSEKDASDMLVKGKGNELYQSCVWDAAHQRQGQLVDIDDDLIQKATVKPEMGIPFPWVTVNRATFGIRPNTIHVVGAAPKVGKSHHEYQLIQHLIGLGHKVGVFDLENAPVKTALRIASKQARTDFTRPDKEFDPERVKATLLSLQGSVRFYDRGASRDWSDIRVCIEEQFRLDDTRLFFIDPLTALISRYNSSEANDKLNEICTDMADLVNMYPITLFCYSHVNPKPKGSKPHETGAKVLSSEFTGSRAMEKWFHYGHGISRDRTDECPLERKNVSEFYMLFDREYGQTYKCDVYFDEDTVQYMEANLGIRS